MLTHFPEKFSPRESLRRIKVNAAYVARTLIHSVSVEFIFQTYHLLKSCHISWTAISYHLIRKNNIHFKHPNENKCFSFHFINVTQIKMVLFLRMHFHIRFHSRVFTGWPILDCVHIRCDTFPFYTMWRDIVMDREKKNNVTGHCAYFIEATEQPRTTSTFETKETKSQSTYFT